MNLLSNLTGGISFPADVTDEDKAIIRDQIMRDNMKFVITWASAESVYWIFDLIMSNFKHDFYLCRNAYAGALIVCLAALLITLLFARKDLKLSHSVYIHRLACNESGTVFMVSSESCDLFVSRSADRTLCRYIQI